VLEGEIADHEATIKRAQEKLEKATKTREEERTAFLEQSKETSELINSVELAEAAISKGTGQGPNLIQNAKLKAAFERSGHQFEVLQLLLGDGEEFLQTRYNPASATIVGILRQMQNEFQADLQKGTEEETALQKDYEQLVQDLNEEIKANQEAIDRKTKEMSEAIEVAEATEVHKTQTMDSLAIDMQSFGQMEKMCKDQADAWKTREETRQQEIAAIDAALEVLDNDAARATFAASGSAFLQISQHVADDVNIEEYCEATRCKSSQGKEDCLRRCKEDCTGACQKRLNAKKEVVVLIDNLITDTNKAISDDKENKRNCKEHEQKYTVQLQEATDLKARHQTNLEKLQEEKARLQETKQTTQDQKVATELTQSTASAARAEDKEAFEKAKGDDEAARDLMISAIGKLNEFYKKEGFLQGEPSFEFEKVSDAASMTKGLDAEFGGTKQSAVVISLMTNILENIKREIAEDQTEEDEAIAAHEKLDAELAKQIDDYATAISNLATQISDKDGEINVANAAIVSEQTRIAEAEMMLDETENESEQAGRDAVTTDGFKSMEFCKFVYASFDARKTKNLGQIEALNSLKGFIYSYNVGGA